MYKLPKQISYSKKLFQQHEQVYSQTCKMPIFKIVKDKHLSVKIAVQLYVLIMSRTRFRVNPYSIVAWKSRNFLLETGAICEA